MNRYCIAVIKLVFPLVKSNIVLSLWRSEHSIPDKFGHAKHESDPEKGLELLDFIVPRDVLRTFMNSLKRLQFHYFREFL